MKDEAKAAHASSSEPLSAQLERLALENAQLRAQLVQSATNEGRLPAQDAKFQMLVEAMPQLVWTCGPDGRCNYLGPQWVAYTGTPEAEQLGDGWLEKLHPEDRERFAQQWAQSAEGGVTLDVDFRIRRADGVHRWFKTRAVPSRGPDGRLASWLGTNTDIDELRRAKDEVRRLTVGLEMQVAERSAELKVVSERLIAATSAARVGIWDWDVVNDHLLWDASMYALYEVNAEDFPGAYDAWQRAVHPEDVAAASEAVRAALAGDANFDVRFRVVMPGGSLRHIHAAATVHRDASGKPERMVGVNWDVTREVQAQEQLQVNEERWNLALAGTGDGVWDWDLITDKIFLSRRSNELLGYENEELTPADFRATLVHPDDLLRTREAMNEHLRGDTASFNCEYRLRRRDGTHLWILGRGRVIARDSTGRPLRIVGTHKDITERRRVQEALEHREALLREFIAHTPAAIAMLDRNLCYLQASRRWLKDYKLVDQDIVGLSHYEVFPDIPERWKQIHQRVLAGAVESCEEEAFPRADGRMEWLQWEVRPWYESDGTVGGLIFFTQVITERKQLGLKLEEQNRRLSRSNAELEQFAYVASHDLQEPLRAIAGCTQILARRYKGRLDADADTLVHHIVDGAARMKTLIEGLLSLSRVGSQDPAASQVDTMEVLTRVLENLETGIAAAGATVTVGPLPSVRGDATQLLQLFQNLIGNALKYRHSSAPAVWISALPCGEMQQFSVRDNGIGIDAQYFERIFGVFQRLHTREEYPGTGIGLAICRKIVERHGGRIWLESVQGRGTTFHFTLPA